MSESPPPAPQPGEPAPDPVVAALDKLRKDMAAQAGEARTGQEEVTTGLAGIQTSVEGVRTAVSDLGQDVRTGNQQVASALRDNSNATRQMGAAVAGLASAFGDRGGAGAGLTPSPFSGVGDRYRGINTVKFTRDTENGEEITDDSGYVVRVPKQNPRTGEWVKGIEEEPIVADSTVDLEDQDDLDNRFAYKANPTDPSAPESLSLIEQLEQRGLSSLARGLELLSDEDRNKFVRYVGGAILTMYGVSNSYEDLSQWVVAKGWEISGDRNRSFAQRKALGWAIRLGGAILRGAVTGPSVGSRTSPSGAVSATKTAARNIITPFWVPHPKAKGVTIKRGRRDINIDI